MIDMEIQLIRKMNISTDKFTKGEMIVDGVALGVTCEDCDRHLENGGKKVPGETAIPRGRYQVILSMSNRFEKIMPEIRNVPGFTGVRIHGGNTAKDTAGCPLLGNEFTPDGVRGCDAVNRILIRLIQACIADGGKCWIEVT